MRYIIVPIMILSTISMLSGGTIFISTINNDELGMVAINDSSYQSSQLFSQGVILGNLNSVYLYVARPDTYKILDQDLTVKYGRVVNTSYGTGFFSSENKMMFVRNDSIIEYDFSADTMGLVYKHDSAVSLGSLTMSKLNTDKIAFYTDNDSGRQICIYDRALKQIDTFYVSIRDGDLRQKLEWANGDSAIIYISSERISSSEPGDHIKLVKIDVNSHARTDLFNKENHGTLWQIVHDERKEVYFIDMDLSTGLTAVCKVGYNGTGFDTVLYDPDYHTVDIPCLFSPDNKKLAIIKDWEDDSGNVAKVTILDLDTRNSSDIYEGYIGYIPCWTDYQGNNGISDYGIALDGSSIIIAYPNPFVTSVNISCAGMGGKLKILNMQGKIMMKTDLKYGRFLWKSMDCPNGAYVIEVNDGLSKYSKQILHIR